MRELIHKAIIGSRDVLDGVMGDFSKGNTLTDDELLSRYTALHRGNPRAMAKFVTTNAPPGTDPMKAWRQYESTMEEKLKSRGQQMVKPGYLKYKEQQTNG